MNQAIVPILLIALLLLFVAAPFAGLAPLLLVLLVAGIVSSFWTFFKILLPGSNKPEREASD